AHVGRSIYIVLRKYCSLVHVPALYIEVLGRNPAVGGMPILISVDDLNWIIDIRRNALDERNLVLDRDGVGHDQCLRVMRARADSIDRTAASLNPDEVVSKVVQLLLDS